MKEEDVRHLLDIIPGAKRGAEGVIVELEDGGILHYTGIERADPDLTDSERFYTDFCSKNEIIRLRSLRTSYDYMLRVRAEAIVASTRIQRAFRHRRRLFENRGRVWSLTDYYNHQNQDAKRYIARLKRPHQKLIKAIPYGLAPLNEVNAVAMKSVLGEVVLVSENLHYFYYFMNVAMYGGQHDLEVRDRVDAAIIALRLMRGSESFDFEIDPRGSLPPHFEQAIQNLCRRQMEFTFGHEFAHFLEGHLASDVTGSPTKVYSFECEFTADRQAVVLASSDKKSRDYLSCGAYDVLLYLHFLELAAEAGHIPKFSISGTHPPALERLRNVRERFDDAGQPDRSTLGMNIREIRRMIEFVGKRLEFSDRDDLLTFYGSMYLPSFTERLRQDRIEF